MARERGVEPMRARLELDQLDLRAGQVLRRGDDIEPGTLVEIDRDIVEFASPTSRS
jgi:hypothetical protein